MTEFVVTLILVPLIYVFRDYILWFFIEKFILTEKLKYQIKDLVFAQYQLNNKYNNPYTIRNNQGIMSYKIGDKEVSQGEYIQYKKAQENWTKIHDDLHESIRKKHNLVNFLIKHFKQDKDSNPISRWQEQSIKHLEDRYNKDV